jgi:hypothetical protein
VFCGVVVKVSRAPKVGVSTLSRPTMLLASRLASNGSGMILLGEVLMNLITIFHPLTGHVSIVAGELAEVCLF